MPSEKPTILINVAMDPGTLTGGKLLRRVLEDNPDLRARVNLVRLVAAAASEVASVYIDRAAEKLRSGVTDLIEGGKTRLQGFARRWTGRRGLSAPPSPPTLKAPVPTS